MVSVEIPKSDWVSHHTSTPAQLSLRHPQRRPARLTSSDQPKCPRAFPAVLLARAENLLVDPPPFRALPLGQPPKKSAFHFLKANLLVDTIGVILSLNGDTRASTDGSGHRRPIHHKLLCALQLRASVHPVARIQYDTWLIGP